MRLLIGGDVCPTHVNDYFEKGDAETLFGDVASVFAKADRVLINFECAMTESDGKIKKCGPNLKATPKCAEVLKKVGVTDAALSNNHIFDFGVQGALDTMKALSDAGISHIGFGKDYADSRKNLVMDMDGRRVAIIDVCEHEYCYALEDRMGARPFDPFDTISDIRAAKAENDFVVVLYHGGKEHCPHPSPRLVKACRAMADHGADVVLCQHSHCIGGYENHAGSHILYGQGNFHFCGHPFGRDDSMWNTGLLVQLDITDKIEIEFIPVESVTNKDGIRLAVGDILAEILMRFNGHTNSLADGTYKEGWKAFCNSITPGYAKSLLETDGGDMDIYAEKVSSNERFAHYLYCEAHHDVFMEIYRLPWELRELK